MLTNVSKWTPAQLCVSAIKDRFHDNCMEQEPGLVHLDPSEQLEMKVCTVVLLWHQHR